jgi:hypothetical protein
MDNLRHIITGFCALGSLICWFGAAYEMSKTSKTRSSIFSRNSEITARGCLFIIGFFICIAGIFLLEGVKYRDRWTPYPPAPAGNSHVAIAVPRH